MPKSRVQTRNDPLNKKSQGAIDHEGTVPTNSPFYDEWKHFSELEQKIFLLAKEHIKKHHVLDVQSLELMALRIFNDVSPAMISQSIHSLLSRKVLFEGGMLTRETVLSNETRNQVFDIILKHPGIYMSAIKNILKKDSKTVLIHLKILERFDMIRVETISGNKVYFDIHSSKDLDAFFHFIQNGKALDLLKAIIQNPGSSIDDLKEIMENKISSQALERIIILLFENKLIMGKIKSNRLYSLEVPERFASMLSQWQL